MSFILFLLFLWLLFSGLLGAVLDVLFIIAIILGFIAIVGVIVSVQVNDTNLLKNCGSVLMLSAIIIFVNVWLQGTKWTFLLFGAIAIFIVSMLILGIVNIIRKKTRKGISMVVLGMFLLITTIVFMIVF